ncbi:hypothetical protein EDB81DRAFT_948753 [Dactylonectria macrodidyma]|uniref:Polysaccharide lyase family 20 protein n=1 Tax=Dactylonectria macrodidyma TaxID=307937 RepID=A0A9P9EQ41_9HYPO|nr:hypothetical protein EDB81DRAFT_948753 [Dactylonectria macrodidyma]
MILSTLLVTAGLQGALAGTLYSSDFSSSLSPFSACNVKSPSSVTVSNGNAVFYFDEANFDGTRNDKGVEICVLDGTTNVPQMHKEGWQGFRLYVPSTTFPTTKNTIIAQQFCPGGCSSWCGTLEIADNTLFISHRPACVDPTEATVVSNIARDTWHSVVVHMKVSNTKTGVYEVWWDGTKVYSATGINVGFGTWSSGEISEGWYFKNGQYCFDTEAYNDGTRTLKFDNVRWYETDNGEVDGYDTVAP